MDELTEYQKDAFRQFKNNIQDILLLRPDHYTDAELIKFLQTGKFNIRKTEKTFRTVNSNKTLFRVYDIFDWYKKPEVAEKFETQCVLGFAKDGSIVRYVAAGRLDFYGFIMCMSASQLCHYFSYFMELDMRELRKKSVEGKNIHEVTYIIDIEGFSIRQVMHQNVIEMGTDFVHVIQYYYPRIWKKVFLINVPSAFGKAFNLFKSVMSSELLDKLSMTSKDDSKELLLKYIDEDVLPVSLGGTRVDSKGDPECKEFISYGGKIPESFYAHNSQVLLDPADPDVKTLTIRPRSISLQYEVLKEPDSVIHVIHRSENGSMGMALYFKELGSKSITEEMEIAERCIDCGNDNCPFEQASVWMRAQIHCVQDYLKAFCPRVGLYILKYDNSTSWFTSRKVYFRRTVYPPNSPENKM